MKRQKWPVFEPKLLAVFIGVLVLAGGVMLLEGQAERAALPAGGTVPFQYTQIDGSTAGDCKMVGDIDGDGFPDLVIGGMPDEKLNWYRYPTWEKTVIATANTEFTTDGALGDVDGDNDLDIVVPDGPSGNNLLWFENPRPGGDPGNGNAWTRHEVGAIGDWGKDVELADYDGNGRLDVATRDNGQAMIFFQNGANTWQKMTFSGLDTGSEGMASGDIDGDTDVDLVLHGVWVRNPGGAAAQTPGNWTEYNIGSADSDFKALVVDLDQNGVADVLFSSSEGVADVVWWTPSSGDPTGAWTSHLIMASLEKAHTLQAADMDLDGDTDVVLAQMHTSSAEEIMVMENTDGQATAWQKQVVDTGGIHNGVVADIGNDGDYDIYGANWTGNPPVKLWENQLDPPGGILPLDQWTYKQVTDAHTQTFGLTFADVNGDGLKDIVSGRDWYRNPGGDMLGTWTQTTFPAGMHAILSTNVDDDNRSDIIAQKDEGDIALYWLEATDAGGTAWNAVQIGTVDGASHSLGAQGYRVAQVELGGKPELLISSGNGIYYFRIPANPAGGNWPRVHINGNPSDEGFAVGNIDGDNLPDVAATTGDSLGVVWYKNPGDGSADWSEYQAATFSDAVFPDRTELADLNNDDKLDIVVTEENGNDNGAETYWWEQPADPTSNNWPSHLIVSQATTNSMDVADMDQDGDTDVILGEHRGAKTVAIWENVNDGATFSEHVVSTGRESHLGARTVDLDGDGDLDIVSIAWDDSQFVHLWRNDALNGGPIPTATATHTATPTATPTTTGTPTPSITPGGPTLTPTPTGTPMPSPTPVVTRVTDGQQVLYAFAEQQGNVVEDVSGVGEPLSLTIADQSAVTWPDGGGLTINTPTLIASAGPASKLINAAQTTNEITVEAWVAPANTTQNGPVRIVTLSSDPFLRNFTLGQEESAYDMRLRTTETSDNGTPSLSSADGMVGTALAHVVYTRNSAGMARLYVDGLEVASTNVGGDFSNWDDSYRFALGNELSDSRPWLGTYYLVAVFAQALTPEEVMQNFHAGPGTGTGSGQEKSYLPLILRPAAGAAPIAPAGTDPQSQAAADDAAVVSDDAPAGGPSWPVLAIAIPGAVLALSLVLGAAYLLFIRPGATGANG